MYIRDWEGTGRLGSLGSVCHLQPFLTMGGPHALLAALWALGAFGASALRIGAFNIQSFSDNKVSDPECSDIIAQVNWGLRAEAWLGWGAGRSRGHDPRSCWPVLDPGWL